VNLERTIASVPSDLSRPDEASEMKQEGNLLIEAVSLLVQRQRELETWMSEQLWRAEQRAADSDRRNAELEARLAGIELRLAQLVHEFEPTADDDGIARLRQQIAGLRGGQPLRVTSKPVTQVGLVGAAPVGAVQQPSASSASTTAVSAGAQEHGGSDSSTLLADRAVRGGGTVAASPDVAHGAGRTGESAVSLPMGGAAQPVTSVQNSTAPTAAELAASAEVVAPTALVAAPEFVVSVGDGASPQLASAPPRDGVPSSPPPIGAATSASPQLAAAASAGGNVTFWDLLGSSPQDRAGVVLIGLGAVAVIYAILAQLRFG
jgi:hypothetical protein